MGTNYYVALNYCYSCKRHERLHIGKSSHGWTFTFRGYRDEYIDELEDELTILSLNDWKKFLADKLIVNEYREIVPLRDLLKLIESKKDEKFNHTLEARKNRWGERCWLDEEKNSFSSGEFS